MIGAKAESRWAAGASPQRPVQERQAAIHAVVDAGVRVVELLVAVRHAVLREQLRQLPAAVVESILIAPAAVDEDAAQALQALGVARDEVNRIVLEPSPPALAESARRSRD